VNHQQNLEKYVDFFVVEFVVNKNSFIKKIKQSLQKQLLIKSKELEEFQSNITKFKIEIEKKAESQILNELNANKIKSSLKELEFER
jgi:hypothetical protein